jgi:hypothetical protein
MQAIGAGSFVDFTFANVQADSQAFEGIITIDATLIGGGTDNDDFEADTPGIISIRDEYALDISAMYADSPVAVDSLDNVISMNITNLMYTDVEITGHSINIQGWDAADYTYTVLKSEVGTVLSKRNG